jgi:hypothetical protein
MVFVVSNPNPDGPTDLPLNPAARVPTSPCADEPHSPVLWTAPVKVPTVSFSLASKMRIKHRSFQ